MRIWDVKPEHLCRNHLLGEHAELHAIWSVLTQSKRGYSRHPEVLRWKGKLAALFQRHEALVTEMTRSNYKHESPLDRKRALGERAQRELLVSVEEQKRILRSKRCGCAVEARKRSGAEHRAPSG